MLLVASLDLQVFVPDTVCSIASLWLVYFMKVQHDIVHDCMTFCLIASLVMISDKKIFRHFINLFIIYPIVNFWENLKKLVVWIELWIKCLINQFDDHIPDCFRRKLLSEQISPVFSRLNALNAVHENSCCKNELNHQLACLNITFEVSA